MTSNQGLHEHCASCFRSDCKEEGDGLGMFSCPMGDCPNKCGLHIHLCKMTSHFDVCEKQLVDCFCGCPMQDIPRCQMRDHLKVCPAYQVITDSGLVRRDEFQDYIKLQWDLGDSLANLYTGKCPLAQYGCPFTYRKIKPLKKNNISLVYDEKTCMYACKETNPCSSSEIITSSDEDLRESEPEKTLESSLTSLSLQGTRDIQDRLLAFQRSQSMEAYLPGKMGILDLPLEILDFILSFLDSYSLHNLSKTCHVMRDICSTQLQKKGMLMSVWTQAEDKSWFISHQTWKFSGTGEGIPEWEYCGDTEVLNHLRKCPYNTDHNTSHRTEPVKLIGLQAADHTS